MIGNYKRWYFKIRKLRASHLTSINKNYVITIIDKFSRFAVGYTIPARDSLNIVKSIKKFISQYGVPKKIICDQGAEYASALFRDFCRQYGIELHVTSFQQSSSIHRLKGFIQR